MDCVFPLLLKLAFPVTIISGLSLQEFPLFVLSELSNISFEELQIINTPISKINIPINILLLIIVCL